MEPLQNLFLRTAINKADFSMLTAPRLASNFPVSVNLSSPSFLITASYLLYA